MEYILCLCFKHLIQEKSMFFPPDLQEVVRGWFGYSEATYTRIKRVRQGKEGSPGSEAAKRNRITRELVSFLMYCPLRYNELHYEIC